MNVNTSKLGDADVVSKMPAEACTELGAEDRPRRQSFHAYAKALCAILLIVVCLGVARLVGGAQ